MGLPMLLSDLPDLIASSLEFIFTQLLSGKSILISLSLRI
jgi:hypothetical protein